MTKRRRYKDQMLQGCYDAALRVAADNFSEFYTPPGRDHGAPGPRMPRTGAGHRWAFWRGYWMAQGRMPRREIAVRNSQAWAFWAAGLDFAEGVR